jgi:hypothetical protein
MFVPFDPVVDYDEYVDGGHASTVCERSLAAREIELPEGSPADPPEAETVHGLGNRRTCSCSSSCTGGASRPTTGPFATCAPSAMQGCTVPSSLRVRTAARCSGSGYRRLVRGDDRRCRRRTLHLMGKPAPDTVSRRRSCIWAAACRGGGVRRPLAGVAAGRAGGFGLVVGVDRAGQAFARCASTRRHRRLGPGRAPRAAMIRHTAFSVEPWSVRETQLDLDCLREPVGVRARQRAHRAACESRRGRAVRFQGRTSTRSTSFGRFPTPKAATATPSRARRSCT